MIDHGANPHIRDVDGNTRYNDHGLSNLKNVPSIKSVFYPIKNFPSGNLGEPWCYTTGVYDGKFGQVIGKGVEGIVVQGMWCGRPAAYKFVQMKGLRFINNYDNSLAATNERLNEMTEMITTPGDAILPFEAHFR